MRQLFHRTGRDGPGHRHTYLKSPAELESLWRNLSTIIDKIIIYNELRMRGYSVDAGVVTTSEKDWQGRAVRKQLEVDFVCNLGASRYYIQSAWSLPDEAKRSQEIRPFRKISDSFRKIIITRDIVRPYYDDFGILTVNIYDFLLDKQIPGNL